MVFRKVFLASACCCRTDYLHRNSRKNGYNPIIDKENKKKTDKINLKLKERSEKKMQNDVIITTQDLKEPYEFVDIVSVTVTEGLHVGLDFIAKWKNVLGGRIKSFEKKTDTAVQAGKEKLRQMAISIGAKAIIGLRIVPYRYLLATIQ